MGLISNCDNATCWQHKQCYRHMQQAGNNPGAVCTRILVNIPVDGEPCDYFVAITPGDRLRKDDK